MDYIAINKHAWDQRTKIHLNSSFYDLHAFIAGKSSLNPIELEQVGNVQGKNLLHLQCHFGQDSLSWARLGAKVTGVDLSAESIATAQQLANQLQLDAHFINSDIYQFGQDNTAQYDIVFTSYGVLAWLPDLTRWADTIAGALRPGGEFHLVEFHPFNDVLSGYGYFAQLQPDVEDEATYTENHNNQIETVATWPHPISEVISALINAGLTIEIFNEHQYSPYNCSEGLTFVDGKGYQFEHQGHPIPLIYSIKAKKLS
ncbi:class I SAM-dependent methyltransferase [Shewanella inventionis]|uniref:Type 12 methyltransferase n=1 Tax=Shewanella inventionis TaxID=1738770 RepID=A0ABQ1J6L5_9GAMM|nr:class I SAM-dependent methyltransferase [Shewanella inventionis]MCL1158773.1 class I SAM-dependent methyltransferase [Shewanella inventionis]UAL42916.1 class I SAM-dependent methyltransferase [Shewanella inventionis]GGB61143.1 type 12 methyltransferase [Shewanella inventionis]